MGTVKKQKRARKGALKNRYCAGAKLSEHKFLRLLHGYAEAMTIQELATTTHVSSKTIRATYRKLRERLADVVFDEPESFGGAGIFLNLPEAGALLDAIKASAQFRRYRKRHAPRLKDEREKRLLLMEFAVRVFCALDLRNTATKPDILIAILTHAVGATRAREPLQELAEFIPGAKPHAHPELKLYDEFRRHLLKNPLGV